MHNLMNYCAIFINSTCMGFVCFLADSQVNSSDNHRSNLHVKFKFMDIPHEFVINNRIPMKLKYILMFFKASVNVQSFWISLLSKHKLFICHYLELQNSLSKSPHSYYSLDLNAFVISDNTFQKHDPSKNELKFHKRETFYSNHNSWTFCINFNHSSNVWTLVSPRQSTRLIELYLMTIRRLTLKPQWDVSLSLAAGRRWHQI